MSLLKLTDITGMPFSPPYISVSLLMSVRLFVCHLVCPSVCLFVIQFIGFSPCQAFI